MGKPLEAAVIIGSAPNIGYASVSQLPKDLDEFSVAGGIAGKPIELVKCKTVDLEVPVGTVDDWCWSGPTDEFVDVCGRLGVPGLATRAAELATDTP